MSLSKSTQNFQKQRMRFSSDNFRNDKLHHHLDEAKQFTNNVARHLLKEKQQNHLLSTATKSYDKFQIRKQTRSHSHLYKYIKKQPQNQSDIILRNPESQDLINAFQSKAQRFPQLGNLFFTNLEQKISLQGRIYELKRQIISEKKRKDKITTNNCRMDNQIQRLRANIKRYSEQSRNDDTLINEALNDCLGLQSQLIQLSIQNSVHRQKISNQDRRVHDYHNQVLELKRFLANQTKQLHKLKELQTVTYKFMMNDYMLQNQLKEEKALILSDIEFDYHKNS